MAIKKKSSRKSSESEKRISKILKEIKNPKPTLRVIGYILSDDGETRTEIGAS